MAPDHGAYRAEGSGPHICHACRMHVGPDGAPAKSCRGQSDGAAAVPRASHEPLACTAPRYHFATIAALPCSPAPVRANAWHEPRRDPFNPSQYPAFKLRCNAATNFSFQHVSRWLCVMFVVMVATIFANRGTYNILLATVFDRCPWRHPGSVRPSRASPAQLPSRFYTYKRRSRHMHRTCTW